MKRALALLLSLFALGLSFASPYIRSVEMAAPSPDIKRSVLRARLEDIEDNELYSMLLAGRSAKEWQALMKKTGSHPINELVLRNGRMRKGRHYPESDVFDPESASLYFYHVHREKEHGHFHLYVYGEEDQYAHVVGISVDEKGVPLSLFTFNGVSQESGTYKAASYSDIVDQFNIEHGSPSYMLNQWLTCLTKLFKPQIIDLHSDKDLSKKIARTHISIDMQIDVLEEILSTRNWVLKN